MTSGPEIRSAGAPFITVAVLTYNERDSLEAVVRELCGALEQLARPFEVLIIDDGSTDGSGEIAMRLSDAASAVRVVRHASNLGLGGAYRTGFREARGECLTFFPADGQFPATILEQFMPLILQRDMVLGYLPEKSRGAVEAFWSTAERALYRMWLGPMPRFQGIMMFRRALLDHVPLRSTGRGWAVVMELIMRVSRDPRWTVVSVPTEIRPRASGLSKVRNLRTIVANLRQMIALRAQLRSRNSE